MGSRIKPGHFYGGRALNLHIVQVLFCDIFFLCERLVCVFKSVAVIFVFKIHRDGFLFQRGGNGFDIDIPFPFAICLQPILDHVDRRGCFEFETCV